MRAKDFILEDNPDYDEDRYLKSDPGTPLSFPKGTTLVNVSDVYDWYKLGMAVSDLDDADPRTFNKGVPHTVFAFGSEEEEHKMIPLLKRLGFSLHDIDSPEDYEKAIRADEAIAHLEEMAGDVVDFGDSVEYQGLVMTMQEGDSGFKLFAASPQGRELGSVEFWYDTDGTLRPLDLKVDERYRGQGIAATMYDFVTSQGFRIARSSEQTPAGRAFWDKNRPDQRIWEDVIDEMAGVINVGISQALAKKGYKYLGGGIDKQAYLEPGTGQVLVVFGYRKGQKDFSPDQRMFIDWINYCNKNANNPHLPKFSGFETFQFGGQNYIQARMEPLQELSDDVGMLVHQIDDAVSKAKQNFKKQIKNITSYASFASAEEGDNIGYELEDTIEYLGGEQAAMNLLKTVRQVQQFARKHQFTVDLHRGNYMARSDGTIVVNDPFVLWLTSSGNRQPWGLR